jgi:hypothetical protein
MKIHRIILYFILIILPLKGFTKDVKDTIKVGFYINSIYDIDYKKGTYKVSLFVWTVSNKKIYELDRYLDFMGQVDYKEFLNHEEKVVTKKLDTLYWSEIELQIELLQEYNSKKFPFDKENIKLSIEFTDDDSDSTLFEIDQTSVLDKLIIPNGWKIQRKPEISYSVNAYSTSFGDPRLSSYKVNTVNIQYELSRESFAIFIKIFVALFISFLIACSSVYISNEKFEPKLTLIVGGLFGTISNKYITDNFLPESTSLNLSDNLHLLTILYLLLITITTIIENRYKIKDNIKYENYIFFGLLISYISITLMLIII